MIERPEFYPIFAETDVVDAISKQNNKRKPRDYVETEGYKYKDSIARQEFNYILNLIYKWIVYCDKKTPRQYNKADLPAAADNEGGLVYVKDATGGACIAFSNGQNWLRISNNTTIN